MGHEGVKLFIEVRCYMGYKLRGEDGGGWLYFWEGVVGGYFLFQGEALEGVGLVVFEYVYVFVEEEIEVWGVFFVLLF